MRNRVLWEPSTKEMEHSNIASFSRWLEDRLGDVPGTYHGLWQWSVEELEDFWDSVWQYFGVKSRTPYKRPLEERTMPGTRWFPGSLVSYAEQVFLGRDSGKTAIISRTEESQLRTMTWGELLKRTSTFADSLTRLGIGKGDRVAACLPNIPETVVSLLACASIGAIWSSCAPDFGVGSAVDRFKQIDPKALIAVEGYSYRGKWISKREFVEDIRRATPSIERTIIVGRDLNGEGVPGALQWEDLAKGGAGASHFEPVPFDHPLWIVYSSGTTGLPKPIVHGHGGILLEHYKVLALHNDLRPEDRMFWYTSTGWMMWNYLVGALLLGTPIILYDGDPFYPDGNTLWSLADNTGMTFLGGSAAYINALMKSGVEPASSHSLASLRGVGSTGSALTADAFEWVYSHVKPDIWLTSVSGGTDLCTAFVGGCPVLPVRAGEIQCINLGADIASFDETGRAIVGQMGELVIRQPMPSMPVYLWGDATGDRYRESYFATYPGVWRHGDWITIFADGGCIIFGRSDATIKRMGVRMGTSEIYRVVEGIPQVSDSLVVDTEVLGGASYMPLFVVLREGAKFDEELKRTINDSIRRDLSPRMVPNEIIVAPAIPRTLNGKKLEVPVRRILLGSEPSRVYNPGSLRNPECMEFYIEFARTRGSSPKQGTN